MTKSPSMQPSPSTRPSIGQMLIETFGIHEDDVPRAVQCHMLPWRMSLLMPWRRCDADRRCQEAILIDDLVKARSADDIDEAFVHYRGGPNARGLLFRLAFGRPSQRTVLAAYSDLKEQWRKKTGDASA